MKKKQWESTSLDWVLEAWAEAAGAARDVMPRKVADFIASLDWDGNGGDAIDAYDIVEAACDACRACCSRQGHPLPRGLDIAIEPTGAIAIVWENGNESDRYKLSLWFLPQMDVGPRFASQCEEYGKVFVKYVLCCEYESELSPRLEICERAAKAVSYGGLWST